MKNSFTIKAQFGILLQASYVSISGADLSTAPNADQRSVNTITNTYGHLTLAETGAAGIKVTPGFTGIKMINVNVTGTNVPDLHVDGSNVDIIYQQPGSLPDYLCRQRTQQQLGHVTHRKTQFRVRARPSPADLFTAVTITGDGGNGVNMTGPFSGIELNGKTAPLSISGNGIRINGTGTESGTGSDRNAGISAWGGISVTMAATDSRQLVRNTGCTGREKRSSASPVPDARLIPSSTALLQNPTG